MCVISVNITRQTTPPSSDNSITRILMTNRDRSFSDSQRLCQPAFKTYPLLYYDVSCQCRFGKSNYFLAPHYPINPRMIKFGLSWNFFDWRSIWKISEIRSDGYPCSNPILHLLQKENGGWNQSAPRLCRNSGIGNPACRYRVQLNQFLCRRRHRFRFPLRTAPCFCTQQRTETGNHSRNELFQKTGRRTKGTYDILANSTVVTTEYKDSLLFTRPIILNKQVLVQRKPEKKTIVCTFTASWN